MFQRFKSFYVEINWITYRCIIVKWNKSKGIISINMRSNNGNFNQNVNDNIQGLSPIFLLNVLLHVKLSSNVAISNISSINHSKL